LAGSIPDEIHTLKIDQNMKYLTLPTAIPTKVAVLFAALMLAAARAHAQSADTQPKPASADTAPTCSCESLSTNLALTNITIDSAMVNARDNSCRITATVTHPPSGDRVQVFVALPLKGWNGRFEGTGGGGFSGGSPRSLDGPVRQGFAVAATDTGHEGGSGSFALDPNGRLNWQAIEDNAYLGIHEMTVVGKALTKACYGKAPRYSYFVGGSTGGRQGLMEAQRYPDDYDGIVSSCPAINWARFIVVGLWPQMVMASTSNFVSKPKLDAATAAAIAACDSSDGVTDGVIDDPFHCDYDPKELVGTQIGGSTFTEADADIVRKIWEGPRAHDGAFLWFGMARGADLSALAGTTDRPVAGRPFQIPVDWVRFFLLQDPQWDPSTLTGPEFEHLWKQSIEQYGAIFSADDPDLSRFRDRGGKIIILQGLADQLIMPKGTIDYYERVLKQMGGREKVGQFARLFLAPGVDHGFHGAGATPVSQFEAMRRWVEEGVAPEKLLAERRDRDGKVTRTRPLFPYPQVAKYKGSGSTDDAANFESAMPAN
jgi:feruloyl esterase